MLEIRQDHLHALRHHVEGVMHLLEQATVSTEVEVLRGDALHLVVGVACEALLLDED